jgi:hypothetical protein
VATLDDPERWPRLKVDHRDDLVAKPTRAQDRLHWHLHEARPLVHGASSPNFKLGVLPVDFRQLLKPQASIPNLGSLWTSVSSAREPMRRLNGPISQSHSN